MAQIIYGERILAYEENRIDEAVLRETFQDAIEMNRRLTEAGKTVAYCFLDPLMFPFEAGNQFYFGIFGCDTIRKLHHYRSGASPIHALDDAKRLVDHGFADAVFIFGYDPLLTNRKQYGKEAISKAMDLVDGTGIVSYYNRLSEQFCNVFGLSAAQFGALADNLFDNYLRTYAKNNAGQTKPRMRQKNMKAAGGPLFCITDCANPNLDFAGGLVIASDAAADFLKVPESKRVRIREVAQALVELRLDGLEQMIGSKDRPFEHLKLLFDEIRSEVGISFPGELKKGNLLLDAYTCYPPIPMAFLLAGGWIESLEQLPEFLRAYEITVTGGMNLAGAPWNNPVVNGLVTMYHRLLDSDAQYGIVHGNGGIGEAQGLALLERRPRKPL